MSITDHLTMQKEPTPLLGDRVRMCIPAQAWLDQRHEGGLMGVDVSALRQQRVGMDAGPERMVVLVEEKLIRVDRKLRAIAELYLTDVTNAYGIPWHVKDTKPAPGTELLIADAVAPEREAIPMYLLLVAHPDGTLLEITFYLNPPAASNRGAWMAIGGHMVKSLVPGERRLERKARTVTLCSDRSPEALQIDLAKNFVVSVDLGADFVVHRFEQVGPLDADTGTVGIYLGNHPAYHVSRTRPQPPVTKVPVTLLGQSGEWLCVITESGAIKMETIMPVPDSGTPPLFAHVFLTGMDSEECARLVEMVRTLR